MEKKLIIITTECGRKFSIEAHEIADERAKYYAAKDKDTTYKEEHDFTMGDNYELKDWLQNNMNWFECNTLTEIKVEPKQLSDLDIEEITVQ